LKIIKNFGTRKTEVLTSLIINITAKANDTTDILQIIQNFPKKARIKAKKQIFKKISHANITLLLVLAMFYLSTCLQRFTSYCLKTAKQDDKSALSVPKGFENFSSYKH